MAGTPRPAVRLGAMSAEPSPLHDDWVARDAAVVWHGFTQMAAYTDNSPVIAERAEGHEIVDVDGNRYLDAISSLWVTTLGHRVPELDRALRDQIDRVAHTTLLGNGNRTVVEFAEALAARLPMDRPHLLFASDGAVAVEQALKIAFQFWVNQGVTGRTRYLSFGGAYHGDTVGSLSVGDGGFGTDLFDPLRFDVLRAPGFDDPDAIDAACALIAQHADTLAAVVVEPIVQGAAGMALLPPDRFAALGQACLAHDVLLICDEVAVGFGRTGTLFASEQCGLRPDLMALGKGITGGYLAMSATAANQRVFDAFLGEDLGERTFYHGHSYGGNALAAAVALEHLRLIDRDDVLVNVVAARCAVRRAPGQAGRTVDRRRRRAPTRTDDRHRARSAGRRTPLGSSRQRCVCGPWRAHPSARRRDRDRAAPHDDGRRGGADRGHRGRGRHRGLRMSSLSDAVRARNQAIAASGRWRTVRTLDGGSPRTRLADGNEVVGFASNDYLGLSQHPDVRAAAHAAIDEYGTGAGASRLIVGGRPVHDQLEAALAAWQGTDAALVFPTGFAANLGVLGALVAAGGRHDTVVFSDELNHASIIDGIRAARAQVEVVPHLDLDALAEGLATRSRRHAVVVSDAVFSMDGDLADVDALADLCARHDATLVLDEAHAVLGPEPPAHADCEVVLVGTLSKTLGALGGFVAGSRDVVDLCVNSARSFIFTTAPSPVDSAAALAAVGIVAGAEGDVLRGTLAGHVERLRPGHPSPIVPIVLGTESAALAASDTLLQQGLLVPAIRPPTVAEGTCRLRVALSAAHDPADVDRLAVALAALSDQAEIPEGCSA